MHTNFLKKLIHARIWADRHGQDMVEYALLAGFITVVVGAAFPPVNQSLSTIFSRVSSTAADAAN